MNTVAYFSETSYRLMNLRSVRSESGWCLRFIILVLMIPPAGSASVSAADNPPTVVQELTEDNWDALIPAGKEVDAIYGDYVLRNQYLKAVIARPSPSRHANMTVRSVGGCLIDLTSVAFESDQLSAFYPSRRAYTWADAEIRSAGEAGASGVVVKSDGSETQPEIRMEWRLDDESRFLTATTTWTNTTDKDFQPVLEDDLRADAGKEIMPKVDNGTHELFWFQDIYWQQAYGVHAPGYRIRCNSNARESVLSYEPVSGDAIVVKPGESFSLTRLIFVARHLAGVIADFESATGRGETLRDSEILVQSGGRPIAGAWVALTCGDSFRGTVVTNEQGVVSAELPEGTLQATVTIHGKTYEPLKTTVDRRVVLAVDGHHFGTVRIEVTDGDGQPIPAKIEFRGRAETPTPDFGPESADFFIKNLAYTTTGAVETPLHAGEYDIIVSRGPEYHAAFTRLAIPDGQLTTLKITLPRLVDTRGWISADFHSHSSPSGDNTSSQLGRVVNLVAEHIEFAPCTEHNRISSYVPHIRRFSLQRSLATVSGMELTGQPLPLNHQNVFPLIHKPRTQDGGGPVTDSSPETQMERLAAWDNNSVKLIQQNHPDIGWLFYDRNGDGKPDEGFSRSFGLMNVVEIHPIDPLLSPDRFEYRDGKPLRNLTALNWLQLLNQGFRIYGVVNTDSHYNFHGSGGLRLWLKSSTDEPREISSDEIRDAARNGNVIMSNGPYLEASFRETGSAGASVISGQDLTASSGRITASVRVQCSNWLDIDTVMILVNGRRSEALTFTRDSHPQLFGDQTVRFHHDVELALAEDAHLIVLTGHRTQLLGDVVGPMWGRQRPAAISNPVFVDLAGDGFQPNRDTLDFPLPVKFLPPE